MITTYCGNHGAVDGNTSVSMDHGSCDRSLNVTNISDDPRKQVTKMESELSESLKTITDARKYVKQHQINADNESAKDIKHVRDHADNLVKHVRDMEKAVVDDITTRHKKTLDMLTAELASLDKAELSVRARIKSLNEADTKSDSQVFIDTEFGVKESETFRDLQQRIKSFSTFTSTFVLDNKVASFLYDVKSFGKHVKNQAYKVVLKDTLNVKMENDYDVCDIADMCELKDGTILITDLNNKCIKTLDKSYRVTKSLGVRSEPWGICQTSRHIVAVTLTMDGKVQFVDVRDNGKMTQSFSVKSMCRGIAHSDAKIYVACEGSTGYVAVFDMSGSLLRQIQFDAQDRQLFTVPYHIVITHNGEKVHIADKAAGVITVDRSGRLLSKIDKFKWALGLCAVDDDTLIVCDNRTNKIIQINTHGELVAELLGSEDGIKEPESVFYFRKASTLVVAFDSSNEIKVFEVL